MLSRAFRTTTDIGLRGIASIQPTRLPRRFWDFHVPKLAWDYRPRRIDMLQPHDVPTDRQRELTSALREWVSIPDANLPEPWTCNWSCWLHWSDQRPLPAVLAARYAISTLPLNPIMFNTYTYTTLFGCPETNRFYLCDGPSMFEDLPDKVYAFEGSFPSVEAFIEEADWNKMEKLEPDVTWDGQTISTSTHAKMPSICTNGWRVAADRPFFKRTLRDKCPPPGTFLYEPRQLDKILYKGPAVDRAFREWPRISDADLPEPWSCEWGSFAEVTTWHEYEGQVFLEEDYGLPDLVPAMFVPEVNGFRGDTVVCRPDGVGTYYLLWHENRDLPTGNEKVPFYGALQQFEGSYTSVEHFVRDADWNCLTPVPYIREPE